MTRLALSIVCAALLGATFTACGGLPPEEEAELGSLSAAVEAAPCGYENGHTEYYASDGTKTVHASTSMGLGPQIAYNSLGIITRRWTVWEWTPCPSDDSFTIYSKGGLIEIPGYY